MALFLESDERRIADVIPQFGVLFICEHSNVIVM